MLSRLEYVKDAVAEADPVTRLVDLMKQRRRWLNGTFFAMLYALGNMGRIWSESGHNFGRKFALTMEMVYLTVVLIISTWCAATPARSTALAPPLPVAPQAAMRIINHAVWFSL